MESFERLLARILATGLLVVSLLLTSTKCDPHHFRQHAKVEKDSRLMLDPTAIYEYFEKEGDITWIRPEFNERFSKQYGEEKRSKRLTKKNVHLWESGVVPYTLSDTYTAHDRNVIMMAMSHIEEKTCVRFVERTVEADYLEIFQGAGCHSFIGRQSAQPQGLSLMSGCLDKFDLVLHEICHALGLLHEHTRPDRDDYIDILYDNIYRGFRNQFEIEDPDLLDTLGVGYDYNSVMHYRPDAFGNASTPKITIVADNPGIPIGPDQRLTKLDILKLNILYKCPDDPPQRSTVYVQEDTEVLPPLKNTGCGARFYGDDRGIITSPGFPASTASSQDCEWQVIVPRGFQVQFDFTAVDLRESSSCDDNYIEIYDNLDCTGYRVARLCSLPKISFYTIAHTGCVRFHSTDNNHVKFHLAYTAADIDECAFAVCEHQCVNTPGGYYCTCPDGYFLSADGYHCFDVNECALEGHSCQYKCENFGGHFKCICPDGSEQVGDSCFKSIPLIIPPPVLPLIDSPPALPALIPTQQSANCGGGPKILTSNSGSIQTLGWPSTAYPLNIQCSWDIVCPVGNKIDVNFENSFKIAGQMPDCSKDSVKLFDCNDAVEYGPLCNLVAPKPYRTKCSSVRVVFNSNGARGNTRTGFRMNYACTPILTTTPPTTLPSTAEPTTLRPTTVRPTTPRPTTLHPTTLAPTTPPPTASPNCGGGPLILRDSQGSIESLGWSNNQPYPLNTKCDWRIECPNSKRVRLTFSDSFRVAGKMPDCPRDRVYIRDCNGANTYGPFCHLSAPPQRTSECNAVNVQFEARNQRGITRTGFRLNYQCV